MAAESKVVLVESAAWPGLAGTDAFSLQKAEARLLRALDEGGELDLSGLDLTSLPDCFSRFLELTHFYCTANYIEVLPESICDCGKLAWLDCSGNRLKQLPEHLGRLENLVKLWCQGNELTELPALDSCRKLEVFNCSSNSIEHLPEGLASCKLTLLMFSGNRIATLPESLERCKDLQHFHCNANLLQSIPEGVASLCAPENSLRRLTAYNNPWDKYWLMDQDLGPEDNPTIQSLRDWAAKKQSGRVKPAARVRAC